MGWVEDARKLMQDFVAPELRGISQRIDDLVAGMQKSFAEVERLAVKRQQTSEKSALSGISPCLTAWSLCAES